VIGSQIDFGKSRGIGAQFGSTDSGERLTWEPRCQNEPKSNLEFWKRKLAANTRRDAYVLQRLREQGWIPLVIWECEISDLQHLTDRLKSHLADSAR
jgi:G:T-mismatch repair DNA endonuclease (very short patch repair protein)